MTDLQKTIDEINSKIDIAEIVGGYIPLKRAGRNFRANCPFHHEKTPSFMVSPAKQIYHCFGCGAGGDTISFVMKYENLEFIDALKVLADKAGVRLPQFKGGQGDKKESFTGALYKINELAANYYNTLLIASPKAKEGRKYFAERALDAKTVAKFKLGFASPEWESFLSYAKTKGVSASSLERAGLIIPGKEKDSYFDRFRNRVMFPVFDVRSNIVAFGGRVLDDSLPKYMNSPETEAYVKGRHLYGLNFAIDGIKAKDYVIIVEGYFDLVVPYQSGVTNIVATLGTALTVEQIRLIKRFTNNAVIMYDADEAGEAASLRGLDLLVSEGLYVKVARLPEGMDPDNYVRKYSADAFIKLAEGADSLFDYKLKLLLNRFNPAQAEEKAKITAEMLPTIKRVDNAVLRSDYLKKLSDVLFIQQDALNEELSKVKLDYTYLGKNNIFKERVSIAPAEKMIAGLLVEDPALAAIVREKLAIDDFKSEDIRSIMRKVFELVSEGKNPTAAKIIHELGNENLSHIICEALAETENFVDREKSLIDCIQRMKQDNLKARRQELTGRIKDAELKGDDAVLMKLVREMDSLRSVKF